MTIYTWQFTTTSLVVLCKLSIVNCKLLHVPLHLPVRSGRFEPKPHSYLGGGHGTRQRRQSDRFHLRVPGGGAHRLGAAGKRDRRGRSRHVGGGSARGDGGSGGNSAHSKRP